jgi:hypothetical protein
MVQPEPGWHEDVRRLDMRMVQIDDDASDGMARDFPRLEELKLEQASITGVFVADITRKLPGLRKIELKDCLKVSRDVVEWGEARGVQISWTKSKVKEEKFRGRRVRHGH